MDREKKTNVNVPLFVAAQFEYNLICVVQLCVLCTYTCGVRHEDLVTIHLPLERFKVPSFAKRHSFSIEISHILVASHVLSYDVPLFSGGTVYIYIYIQ